MTHDEQLADTLPPGSLCGCSWPFACAGTGVQHCEPPCGGDSCICVCGGESDCPGCDACEPAFGVDCDYDD